MKNQNRVRRNATAAALPTQAPANSHQITITVREDEWAYLQATGHRMGGYTPQQIVEAHLPELRHRSLASWGHLSPLCPMREVLQGKSREQVAELAALHISHGNDLAAYLENPAAKASANEPVSPLGAEPLGGAEIVPSNAPSAEEEFLQSLPASHPLKRGWASIAGVEIDGEDLVSASDHSRWLITAPEDGGPMRARAMDRTEARAWLIDCFVPESLRFELEDDFQEIDFAWIENQMQRSAALLHSLGEEAMRHLEKDGGPMGGTVAAGYNRMIQDAQEGSSEITERVMTYVSQVHQLRTELVSLKVATSTNVGTEGRLAA